MGSLDSWMALRPPSASCLRTPAATHCDGSAVRKFAVAVLAIFRLLRHLVRHSEGVRKMALLAKNYGQVACRLQGEDLEALDNRNQTAEPTKGPASCSFAIEPKLDSSWQPC